MCCAVRPQGRQLVPHTAVLHLGTQQQLAARSNSGSAQRSTALRVVKWKGMLGRAPLHYTQRSTAPRTVLLRCAAAATPPCFDHPPPPRRRALTCCGAAAAGRPLILVALRAPNARKALGSLHLRPHFALQSPQLLLRVRHGAIHHGHHADATSAQLLLVGLCCLQRRVAAASRCVAAAHVGLISPLVDASAPPALALAPLP